MDFGAGIAVFALGYNNRTYNDAIKNQVDHLIHTSNLYYHTPLAEAAQKVVKASQMDQVFFTNSGTEAIEGAIKLAKKYAKDAAMSKFFVIKGGYFDGMALDQSGIEKLADLPSREELLAKALGSMNAPIANFVSVLANIPRGLVQVLSALKTKKENEQ